jgi:hypothetical protein
MSNSASHSTRKPERCMYALASWYSAAEFLELDLDSNYMLNRRSTEQFQ